MRMHMCISVRGMLNWTNAETKRNMRSITKKDGSKYTSVSEFRNDVMTELSKGREVLPMGDCDNFDYKKGCLGHPEDAPEVKDASNRNLR